MTIEFKHRLATGREVFIIADVEQDTCIFDIMSSDESDAKIISTLDVLPSDIQDIEQAANDIYHERMREWAESRGDV